MTRADALRDLLAAVEAGTWQLSQDAGTLFPDSAYASAFAAFDGSVDAAMAFVEAVLPDWVWTKGATGDVDLWGPDDWPGPFESDASSDATPLSRAMLIAALKALIAQEEANA